MPKLTKEQRAELERQLAEDDATEDDEVELWVKDEKGRETKLTGAHAKRWLKMLGLEDEEPEGDPAGGDPAGGDPADPPPAGGNSVWGRKK